MQKIQYVLKKSNREVLPFPWESTKGVAPFDLQTHMRVVIPFTPMEASRSSKKCHVQIVRKDSVVHSKTIG